MRTCCAHAGDTLVDERPEQRVATALRYKRAAHAAGLDDAGAAAGTYQRQRAAAMCAQQRTRGAGPAGWVAAAVLRNELAAAPANRCNRWLSRSPRQGSPASIAIFFRSQHIDSAGLRVRLDNAGGGSRRLTLSFSCVH